jgi:hypothetical protein
LRTGRRRFYDRQFRPPFHHSPQDLCLIVHDNTNLRNFGFGIWDF